MDAEISSAARAPDPEGLVLWNRLGSEQEVLHSAFGPDLAFYPGDWDRAYVPGRYGGAVAIDWDAYPAQRVRNLLLEDVPQVIDPEQGTIELWYRQTEGPIIYSHGAYRFFDGAYGLESGMGFHAIHAQVNGDLPARIEFYLLLGGTQRRVWYATSQIPNEQWVHLAATWDRRGIGSSDETMQLYVDGVKVDALTEDDWGTTLGSQVGICGGNDQNLLNKFAMDNLIVWDHAVTDFSHRLTQAPFSEIDVACDAEALVTAFQLAQIPEVTTLNLASGCTYTLTEVDNLTDGPNGLPSITGALTVEGNGATIERDLGETAAYFRIMHVAVAGDLTLRELTVRGGFVDDELGGGGILNRGTLTLEYSAVRSNVVMYGIGGGISNAEGVVTLRYSNIEENGVRGNGGGIANSGSMTLNQCGVRDNTSMYYGGGILNQGVLEIRDSTLSGNRSAYYTPDMVGSGGGIANEGTLSVRGSTLSDNYAGWDGGGLHNSGAVELENSTVSGNRVEVTHGGGISNSGTMTATHCTIIDNQVGEEGDGGGIWSEDGTVACFSTLIGGQALGADCAGDAVTSLGYNLDSDGSCTLTERSDLPNTAPLLGPLGDHGGPTMTHKPRSDSPAIDAGSCPATGTGAADQRGLPRPVNLPNAGTGIDADDGCDIGSVEVEPAPNMGRVQGRVYGVGGTPLAAEISFEGLPDVVATDCSRPGACTGGYHQWLVTGSYSMTASAPGYPSQWMAIEIVAGETVTRDVFLASYLYLPIVLK
jgi:hypothetical protein